MPKHEYVNWYEETPGAYVYRTGQAFARPDHKSGGYMAVLGDIKPKLEEALLDAWAIAANEARFDKPRTNRLDFFKNYVAEVVAIKEPEEMIDFINGVVWAQNDWERKRRSA